MKRKLALVAVGGNSLILDSHRPDIPHQWDAVRETVHHLADLVDAGWQLVVTHGNGPQVGYILRRNELAAHEVHTTPLDLIVADTQGAIGYMLQQALSNELYSRGRPKKVVSIITQLLVDENDPAFDHPTKPIGAFLSAEQAEVYRAEGWTVIEDAGRGYRRVVASPQPRQIIEEESIRDLLSADNIVITCGGGGIPVIQNHKGELREMKGVYAVIDKDSASALLAQRLQADLFLISTGVEQVAIHFNTPEQRNLAEVTTETLAHYLAEGHFAPGSMHPKVEAVLQFVENTGNEAIITTPYQIGRALRGETGTHVVKQVKKGER